MAEKRVTNKEKFEMLKALAESADNEMLVEFCEAKIAELDRKNSKSSGHTEQQTATIEAIKSVLVESVDGMQCGAIFKDARVSAGAKSATQVSGLLQQMIKAGEVERVEVKRVAYFKLL